MDISNLVVGGAPTTNRATRRGRKTRNVKKQVHATKEMIRAMILNKKK